MAKVIVTGEVDNVSEYANGEKTLLTIWEQYPSPQGEQWNRKWTIWLDTKLAVSKGDWFELEGTLGTKVSKFVNKDGIEKTTIDHNLNSVMIVTHRKAPSSDLLETHDEDDIRKYGHPTYGSNAPF